MKGEIDLAPRTCRRGAAPVRQHRRQDPAEILSYPCSTRSMERSAIVGLDGVTQVTESLEGLLRGMRRARSAHACCGPAIAGASSAIRHYSTTSWLASRISPSACSPSIRLWRQWPELRHRSFPPPTSLARPPRTQTTKLTPEELGKPSSQNEPVSRKASRVAQESLGRSSRVGSDAPGLHTIEATQDTPANRPSGFRSPSWNRQSDRGVGSELKPGSSAPA